MSDWQRQNMKKGGGGAPSSMHSKISSGQGSFHSKIAAPTHPGNCVRGYADGGVVEGTKEYDEAIEKYREEPRYHGYEDYAPSGRVALQKYNEESAGKRDMVRERGVPPYSRSAAKKAQSAQREYADELQRETRGKIPRARLADGGEVAEEADKQKGLEASKGESVGFFERLRMGNIDDPKSEAYSRFGAGRGRAARDDEAEFGGGRYERPESATPPAAEEIAPAEPKLEQPRMTAADFQRTDKDTTPVETPKTRARPVARPTPPKVAAPKAAETDDAPRGRSIVQSLGSRYSQMDRTLRNTSPTTGGYAALKKARDDALKAYEDASANEREGKSVVFKR